MSSTYRFHLVCPKCNKDGEAVKDRRDVEPEVCCGDCLMDHTEVVRMKVVSVVEETRR